MNSSKKITILNEEDKEVEKHFIGIKTRVDSDAEFFFFTEENMGYGTDYAPVKAE